MLIAHWHGKLYLTDGGILENNFILYSAKRNDKFHSSQLLVWIPQCPLNNTSSP